ncbi:MAG: MotA/TolQ/ExbB proton channel family protein [Deltaproteobacteria bacterium]|nr:MotA/TolQ/ExbB proton channel family protein [Deltaproteobacteria bacterium]
MILFCLLGAALATDPGAMASSLDAAYQKEFAYLSAEKRELEERLQEMSGEAAQRVAQANARLETVQAKLVSTAHEADLAEDERDIVDRELGEMDDANSVLSSTLQQAEDTLDLDPLDDPTTAIPLIFRASAERLAETGAIRSEEGAFFLPEGQQVQGRIFRWGRVAAWGVSDEGSGALAPVAEGKLQLRRRFGQATAAALAAGERPADLEVHLFEPDRLTIEKEKETGLGSVLEDAGAMGYVLFGLGCLSALLALSRAGTLALARRGGMPLVNAVTERVRADRLEEALSLLRKRGGSIPRVLKAVFENAHRSREELDRVVDEAILRETPLIDRFASALVVITAGAPLLGLLGTVTGMIATFNVITEHGTGNPKLMSAGIAEALVCTAMGLAVAIPTLLVGNLLASVGSSVKNTVERGALALVNAFDLQRSEQECAYEDPVERLLVANE